MSGIFGAWHLNGLSVDALTCERCAGRLAPGGPVSATSPTGPLWFASKPGPAITYGHLSCIFDGRLDNRADLEAQLKPHPALDAAPSNAAIVLAAYEQFGSACVNRIDGDFAFAMFDSREQRLLLARDGLGLRPLCYTRIADTFLFATDAKALLAYPGIATAPDDAMLADSVLYFLAADGQRRTFFKGVRSLPPAHCLELTPQSMTVRRYFDFDTTARLRLATVDDYVAAFHDMFTASVRNRLRHPRPVAISVSGGLDSSYIYCVAHRIIREDPGLAPSLTGVNYGGSAGSPSDETRFIEELERATGTIIERVVQRPGFLESACREVRETETAGIEGLARLREAFLSHVRDAGAARVLTGHWGDQVLSDASYVQDLLRLGTLRSCDVHRAKWGIRRSTLAARVARELMARYAPSSVELALIRGHGAATGAWDQPWFTTRFRRILRERFSAPRVRRVAGSSHAWSIYQQVRLGYHLHCMEWNARIGNMYGIEMAFPYLSRAFIQFLISIPGEIHSLDGVQRGLMRRAMRDVVPSTIVNRRSKGEFTQLAREGVEHDFPAIRELLGRNALSVKLGYVDGPVLWSHLDRWRNDIRAADNGILSDRVIDLCGFELLLCNYFRDAAA
ncbi:MAG TPA: asparagine synthase-related protein [Vicinamibacterales bacterium]|nr:asparagine synthase-related protein [Vicinamibacterales bacterium]